MENIITIKNTNTGLDIRGYVESDGQIMINVEDIVRGVKGKYIEFKNGKEYIRLRNIKSDLEKFGFRIESAKDFIPESAMYLLIMNGDGEVSKSFQKWIATEVLPSIRKHGAYIGDDEIDEEYVNNKIRFSEKRTINTFADCSIEDIKQLVDEFIAYAETLDTKTRVVRCSSAVKGITRLHDRLAKESVTNIGDCYNLLRLQDSIKTIAHMAENRHRGQKIAHRNKKIKNLESKIG